MRLTGSSINARILVKDPTERLNGFNLPRNEWATLNRIRSDCGRSASTLHKWGMTSSEECDCGNPTQTIKHILEECPSRQFSEGISVLNEVTGQAMREVKTGLENNPTYSREFSLAELNMALRKTKKRKAAGPDEIFPEFIINSGIKCKRWLVQFYNDILMSGAVPQLFKKSRVVAIKKPGKDGTEPNHFRPIALLCICYKLLERLILNRIESPIEAAVPKEQAGFRSGRDCCEQVLALTSQIEANFQKGLKTTAVFVDLSAAYDTVWRHGLLLKLAKTVPCKRIINLMTTLLSNRYFTVCLSGKLSPVKTLNNGLPQGSVLAPEEMERLDGEYELHTLKQESVELGPKVRISKRTTTKQCWLSHRERCGEEPSANV
uniref:Uncharacterized protein n=1 Tax=Phlebotomus papatasi TaxID=29031 RepID=A0A1B0DMF8_PHLPP